jgi:hypothetical protein
VQTLVPAMEQLVFAVPCAEVGRFVAADRQTWTAFLAAQVREGRGRVGG